MRSRGIDRLLRLSQRPGVISFAGGMPDPETFPRAALVEAAREAVLELGPGALQYDWPEGRPELRAQVALRLRRRGAAVDPDDVLITSGAQDALSLAIEALGCRQVQVDPATYSGAIDLFAARRVAAGPLPAPVAYVMPAVHNPTGRGLDEAGRAAALSARWILEDDAYADLRFDGAAPRPLLASAPDRVFHFGTVSKTLSPGLRIGWLVAPRRFRERLRGAKARRDVQAPGLTQAIVERLFSTGRFDERLAHLRAYYAARCERLLALVPLLPGARCAPPLGGFSLWLELDAPASDEALLARALAGGVAFDPGALFRAAPARLPSFGLRLSFSAVPLLRMEEGIARLARTLGHLQPAPHPLVA